MIIHVNVNSKIKINKLEDLHKLKPIMEGNNLKVNKSQIARELGVNPHTVGKYLNGYVKPITRNRKSKIEAFDLLLNSFLVKIQFKYFVISAFYGNILKIIMGYITHNLRLEGTFLITQSLMNILIIGKKDIYPRLRL